MTTDAIREAAIVAAKKDIWDAPGSYDPGDRDKALITAFLRHYEAAQAKATETDERLDAVMSVVLDEIELGDEWGKMTRPQRLAYLSFQAALGCSGIEMEGFIRGREAGLYLAKIEAAAPDEGKQLPAGIPLSLGCIQDGVCRTSPCICAQATAPVTSGPST